MILTTKTSIASTVIPPYNSASLPDLDRQTILSAPHNDDINRVGELTLIIEVTYEPVRLEFDYDTKKLSITSILTPIVIPITVGTHILNIAVRCPVEFGTEQLI